MKASASVLLVMVGCAKGPVGFTEPPPDGAKVTSPVDRVSCAKLPDTRAAVFASKTYYFCSDDAARRFAAEPTRYADGPTEKSVRTSSTLP
jgi:YHS domain-containing protein